MLLWKGRLSGKEKEMNWIYVNCLNVEIIKYIIDDEYFFIILIFLILELFV